MDTSSFKMSASLFHKGNTYFILCNSFVDYSLLVFYFSFQILIMTTWRIHVLSIKVLLTVSHKVALVHFALSRTPDKVGRSNRHFSFVPPAIRARTVLLLIHSLRIILVKITVFNVLMTAQAVIKW